MHLYVKEGTKSVYWKSDTMISLNDEGGLITTLEVDCLGQKLGTTDCILEQAKISDVNIFPVQNIICGLLNVNPLSNGLWNAQCML